MRWRGNRKSRNVEDRRSTRISGGASSGGGLISLLPMVFKLLGFKGTVALILCVGAYGLFTGNLDSMLSVLGLQQNTTAKVSEEPLRESAEERELVDFVSVVLADTEETWTTLFQRKGKTYQEPRLVLFRGAVKSACGIAQSAIGPFYCPLDQQVYIDLGFYDQLKNRFNAPGDFAQAYVIAHEVGHHIQNLTGISNRVHSARKKLSEKEANKLSVLQELQADCLAGVWANHTNSTRQLLEEGDVEEGLNAASAIGDDTLQRQSQGHVTPDSFTHGSSAQRVNWFKVGLTSGAMDACDTFNTNDYGDIRGNDRSLTAVYKEHKSDVQVEGQGTVTKVLPDDNDGSRHQRFLLKLDSGQTLLIAHNIDLAQRLSPLRVGDQVEFNGEYEWNPKGGVIHWTHRDPDNRHVGGWLRHNGQTYQ